MVALLPLRMNSFLQLFLIFLAAGWLVYHIRQNNMMQGKVVLGTLVQSAFLSAANLLCVFGNSSRMTFKRGKMA